ncbi:MAG: formate dehydrogenase accessory sulfurtransferase FdhD [Alphaproteobacteria bacterium]|jgi:FdhD protein|nr:formate dehydrogenase accessory sulfurtransferase FdhD [Alphaproteobacteria bacterium]
MTFKPSLPVERIVWRDGASRGAREVAAETPVAFVYDGGTEAVMMATPADLEDFALGFSLNDGVIASADDIAELDVVTAGRGIELRMVLRLRDRERLVTRRRLRAGPAGCGLCGVESIAEAVRPLPFVERGAVFAVAEIIGAMRSMRERQALNARTHAVHAAALYVRGEGLVAVREDVGRHNALDKLAGALVRAGRKASDGAVLMTSRVSVELVQKAAMMGASVLAAVSAPTALALEEAESAGLTVAGIVRDDGLEVFTHPMRLSGAR